MRPIAFSLLVISSLWIGAAAHAATRPHYGGTLHISMQSAPASLDPGQANDLAQFEILPLIMDSLIVLDDQGQPRPALARAWNSEAGDQRWHFTLRSGVTFSDGLPLSPETVAVSLRAVNPGWKIVSMSDSIVIERDTPSPDLPAELALPRNAIARRDGGKILGSGPFVVSQWLPRKSLILAARSDYWAGQPFVGSIEISFGQNLRDQLVALDLGKVELATVAPEQAHLLASEGRPLRTSPPAEFVALVFAHDSQSPEEVKLRGALSLSIDRSLLNRVVLQNGGEPAGSLLPPWMTGYGFLFSTEQNLTRAQQERADVQQSPLWKLGFDPNDAIARLLSERIVLNARDAGLRVQATSSEPGDVKLLRLPLSSSDPWAALKEIAAAFGLPQPVVRGQSLDDLYTAENEMLEGHRIIPLLHLRSACVVSKTVKNWSEAPDGRWRLADVWLSVEQP